MWKLTLAVTLVLGGIFVFTDYGRADVPCKTGYKPVCGGGTCTCVAEKIYPDGPNPGTYDDSGPGGAPPGHRKRQQGPVQQPNAGLT
jgi:hypothetical protein